MQGLQGEPQLRGVAGLGAEHRPEPARHRIPEQEPGVLEPEVSRGRPHGVLPSEPPVLGFGRTRSRRHHQQGHGRFPDLARRGTGWNGGSGQIPGVARPLPACGAHHRRPGQGREAPQRP